VTWDSRQDFGGDLLGLRDVPAIESSSPCERGITFGGIQVECQAMATKKETKRAGCFKG
jgi:hypothetical protein